MSDDLGKRVLEAGIGGVLARSIGAQLDVGISMVIRWLRLERESGEGTARRQGKSRGLHLNQDTPA